MVAMQSSEATRSPLFHEELTHRRLVLMPLMLRVLALVAVMLLANIS